VNPENAIFNELRHKIKIPAAPQDISKPMSHKVLKPYGS